MENGNKKNKVNTADTNDKMDSMRRRIFQKGKKDLSIKFATDLNAVAVLQRLMNGQW